jgi:hypothetical protein
MRAALRSARSLRVPPPVGEQDDPTLALGVDEGGGEAEGGGVIAGEIVLRIARDQGGVGREGVEIREREGAGAGAVGDEVELGSIVAIEAALGFALEVAEGGAEVLLGGGELGWVDAGGDVDGEDDGLAAGGALKGREREGEGEGEQEEEAEEELGEDLQRGEVDEGAAEDEEEEGEQREGGDPEGVGALQDGAWVA